MYVCEYCNNEFNRKSNFVKHQKTAQYCLETRGEETKQVQCIYCYKTYSRPDLLLRHKQRRHAVEVQYERAHPEFTKLMMTKMQENVNNNDPSRNVTLNSMSPLTNEDLRQNLQHLSISYIERGGKGYADYAYDNAFNGKVICTDKARKKLKYKNANGQIVSDAYGVKLTKRFFQAIAQRNEELINAEYSKLQQQVAQVSLEKSPLSDGESSYIDLASLLSRAIRLQNLLSNCQEAAQGEENAMTREFINHLSKNL